jgi:polyferredoxin
MALPPFALWPFALLMAVVTAYLIRWAADARAVPRAAVTVFLLVMMAAMLGGAAIYFIAPSRTSLVEGLWVSAAVMSISVFPLFAILLRHAARLVPGASAPEFRRSGWFLGTVAALVLGNELLMGWTFSMAAGASFGPASGGDLLAGLATVVSSSWFLFTMSAEMALSAFLLRDRFDRPLLYVFGAQASIMFLSPTALASSTWVWWSLVLGSGGMILLFVYVMEFIYRHREFNGAFATYLVRLIGLYGLMMAGLFVWLYYGNFDLFALSIVLEMVLYLEAIVSSEAFRAGPAFTWQLHARWAFGLLGTIFVAELFMGALLDLQLFGSSWLSLVPALPMAGSAGAIAYNAVYNGFWFVALVAGSTWFLAMMGVEMGALVYFKFRETRQPELRARLALMIGSYALAATYFPSVYYSTAFPNLPSGTTVPVLGWSMGIGSAPLAPTVFVVVFVTYVIVGVLSLLFGRRVICSVFCTAPLMYQGTAIDAMKSFNRTSPTAHRYLGSRWSRAYTVTMGLSMGSLVVASVVSYFDQIGVISWTILGADPTVFLFALYFGVLWYALFVAIPYAGNYNCVTMGWCYTGTISAAFQSLGFYKLKVKSKQVCKDCTTLDCAKACPVGLVDMVGFFRTKGEFRSSKCCGVGNCVGVCPYGNLYIHDVRHWLRDRVGARRPGPTPLPMVSMVIPRTAGALSPHGPSRPSARPEPLAPR